MQRWKDTIRQHSGLLLLFVGGLLVPLITNLASSWLESVVGQTPNRLLQLLAIGLAAAVALLVLALVLRPRPEPLVLVPREARPERMPGLIALVGRGRPGEKFDLVEQAAAKAIEYHLGTDGTLKVCWLIGSGGAEGSLPAARAIRQAYEAQCTVHVHQVGSAFSVQETYDVVQQIYNQEIYDGAHQALELSPEKVIADFTSGTAPMTAGMVLACGRDRPMQYMTGRRPEIAPTPLLVRFKPTPRRRKR